MRFHNRAVVTVLVLAGSAAWAQGPTGRPPGSVPFTSTTPRPGATGVLPELQPPDGIWQVDKETGRRYFDEAHYKMENGFSRQPDGMIRLKYGLTIKPVGEDENFFYVRVWEPEANPIERGTNNRVPTPEEKAEIAKRYTGTAGAADRIELVRLTSSLPTEGQWRNDFQLVDINADGHLDFVHGPIRKSNGIPQFLLGDGKGNFAGWRDWNMAEVMAAKTRFDYGDIAVADLDGDGHLDVALACHLMGVYILRGDGKGGFAPYTKGVEYSIPGRGGQGEAFSSRELEIADVDGDGRLDVLVLGEGPKLGQLQRKALVKPGEEANDPRAGGSFGVLVYRNNGDGSWTTKGPYLARIFGDSLAVVDLNGDGRLDLLAATMAGGERGIVGIQLADGSFETRGYADEGRGVVQAVAAEDVDGDGTVDLVLHRQMREADGWHVVLEVHWSWGRPELRVEKVLADVRPLVVRAIEIADLDRDGLKDIVLSGDDDRMAILLGVRRDGRLAFDLEDSPELGPSRAGCTSHHVGTADVDRDGAPEIFATYANERCAAEGRVEGWRVVVKPLTTTP